MLHTTYKLWANRVRITLVTNVKKICRALLHTTKKIGQKRDWDLIFFFASEIFFGLNFPQIGKKDLDRIYPLYIYIYIYNINNNNFHYLLYL